MVHYLVCSFCGNETNALSIEDVDVQGVILKGIKCTNSECGKYHRDTHFNYRVLMHSVSLCEQIIPSFGITLEPKYTYFRVLCVLEHTH